MEKRHYQFVKLDVENCEQLHCKFEVKNFDYLRLNTRVNLLHRRERI